jgi:hypothetical protein
VDPHTNTNATVPIHEVGHFGFIWTSTAKPNICAFSNMHGVSHLEDAEYRKYRQGYRAQCANGLPELIPVLGPRPLREVYGPVETIEWIALPVWLPGSKSQ